jgi:NADH:ubiquinone oxidoreductase subunit 2 (subunit N)
MLALSMLSLAGLPPTGGFLGKLYLMGAGIDAGLWPLLVALVINSAIGIVYYLRVVIAAYRPAPVDEPAAEAVSAGVSLGHLALAGGVPAPGTRHLDAVSARVAAAPAAATAVAEGQPVRDPDSEAAAEPQFAAGAAAERLLLSVVTLVVLFLGVYPGPLIGWIGNLLAMGQP